MQRAIALPCLIKSGFSALAVVATFSYSRFFLFFCFYFLFFYLFVSFLYFLLGNPSLLRSPVTVNNSFNQTLCPSYFGFFLTGPRLRKLLTL